MSPNPLKNRIVSRDNAVRGKIGSTWQTYGEVSVELVHTYTYVGELSTTWQVHWKHAHKHTISFELYTTYRMSALHVSEYVCIYIHLCTRNTHTRFGGLGSRWCGKAKIKRTYHSDWLHTELQVPIEDYMANIHCVFVCVLTGENSPAKYRIRRPTTHIYSCTLFSHYDVAYSIYIRHTVKSYTFHILYIRT